MSRTNHVHARRALALVTAALLSSGVLVVTASPALAAPAAGPPVNATALNGNEDESAVAVNPNDNRQLAVMTNGIAGDAGLPFSVSSDGGATWTRRTVATGPAPVGDGFPAACCDPTLSWDTHGNLFLSYLQRTPRTIELLVSTDAGATFTDLGPVDTGGPSSLDQPTVVAGENAVWVTWRDDNGGITARGRSVTGPGTFGAWGAEQDVPGSGGGNFGDIAIGPGGQVLVTYQTPSGGQGTSSLNVHLDADGLGAGGWGAAVTATTTDVGGFDFLPAQNQRSVDAEVGLAYDRSGGPRNGRAYLVYTDEAPDESHDFDIWVRSSTDDGATWSAPVQVNDDGTTRSNMLPRIALDQSNGDLGVTFYSARNDDGTGPNADDLNGVANDDVQLYGAFSFDGGGTWSTNLRISDGTTDGDVGGGQQLGDYTGSDFVDGVLYPSWADSSNSTGDNPNGTSALDVYVAQVFADNSPPDVAVDDRAADEGQAFTLSGHASDADGEVLTPSWTIAPVSGTDPGATCDVLAGAATLTPLVRCSDDGTYTATLTVTGSPTGPASAWGTLTLGNDAPDVDAAASTPAVILEGQSAAFAAAFEDPGFNDTYGAEIDWGTGEAPEAVAATTTTSGPPVDAGSIAGSHAFGDDGVFTITGTVRDDDGGSGSASSSLSVANVAPSAVIDTSAALTTAGGTTFLTSAGSPLTLSGRSQDPGSDDLTTAWDWDDGAPSPDTSLQHLVSPPGVDPDPSTSVQPRDVSDTRTHSFGEACLYDVRFSSTDDDGGATADSVAVMVVGGFVETRSVGYWKAELGKKRPGDHTAGQLQCLLDITGHASSVFHELRDAGTPSSALAVLSTSGSSDMRAKLDAQLLAAWLNFGDGRVAWGDLVDTDRDGVADTPFATVAGEAEALRADPSASRNELERYKDVLDRLNTSLS